MRRHDDRHSDAAVLSRNVAEHPAVVIPILRSGVLAEKFCRDISRANVEAVFERCFYIRRDHKFICVGEPDIGNGPLTLIGNIGPLTGLGLRPGQSAAVCERHITIGNSVRFELDQTKFWRRPAWPIPVSSSCLVDMCCALASRLAIDAPEEGLARYASGASETLRCRPALARIARVHIAAFENFLSETLEARTSSPAASQEAVQGLIGLGPGLTPSGDDFLVGALALLDAIGEPDAHTALARAMTKPVLALTAPLSACFLRAAADGHVGEALHGLASCVVTGDADAAVAAADKIGHSSGWDMLAGMMTALRIVAAARLDERQLRPSRLRRPGTRHRPRPRPGD